MSEARVWLKFWSGVGRRVSALNCSAVLRDEEEREQKPERMLAQGPRSADCRRMCGFYRSRQSNSKRLAPVRSSSTETGLQELGVEVGFGTSLSVGGEPTNLQRASPAAASWMAACFSDISVFV